MWTHRRALNVGGHRECVCSGYALNGSIKNIIGYICAPLCTQFICCFSKLSKAVVAVGEVLIIEYYIKISTAVGYDAENVSNNKG